MEVIQTEYFRLVNDNWVKSSVLKITCGWICETNEYPNKTIYLAISDSALHEIFCRIRSVNIEVTTN